MRFEDKNQTLVPPENYTFRNAASDGAYLKLTYGQSVYKKGALTVIGENIVTIYLNDQGREVGRCIGSVRYDFKEPKVLPASRKFRFKNGCLIIQHGIQELLKCLN